MHHSDSEKFHLDGEFYTDAFFEVCGRFLCRILHLFRHFSAFFLRNSIPNDLAEQFKRARSDRAYTPPRKAVFDVFCGRFFAASETLSDNNGAFFEHFHGRSVRYPSVPEVVEHGLHRARRMENVSGGSENEQVGLKESLFDILNILRVLTKMLVT